MRVMALARFLKDRHPETPLVAGGYHASALPNDLVFDGSPFDAVVVGEGERPLAEIVATVMGGSRPEGQIYGPDPILEPCLGSRRAERRLYASYRLIFVRKDPVVAQIPHPTKLLKDVPDSGVEIYSPGLRGLSVLGLELDIALSHVHPIPCEAENLADSHSRIVAGFDDQTHVIGRGIHKPLVFFP